MTIIVASLVVQTVKCLPAMQETWVRSLGWEDPLEEGMATLQYFCLENPHGQRSLEGYSPWGCNNLDKTERLSMTVLLSIVAVPISIPTKV